MYKKKGQKNNYTIENIPILESDLPFGELPQMHQHFANTEQLFLLMVAATGTSISVFQLPFVRKISHHISYIP